MATGATRVLMDTPVWAWGVFGALILTMIAVDLFLFERRPHARGLKEAAVWSVVWVALALAFNVGVYFLKDGELALQFTTAYLLEKSLSVDNLFIFLVIFRFFGVEERYQPRVLFWGILGALVMRAILIGAGVSLLHSFGWVMYIFGAILIYTGVKLFVAKDESYEPSQTLAYRLTRRYVRLTEQYHAEHFFVREGGKLLATPLFLVLVIVETTDLVFAVDSIPACLGVSQDLFIVYTSNVFAILGLRALYFVLAGLMGHLRFLKPALAIVLAFIGVKMSLAEAIKGGLMAEPWSSRLHISTGVSLAVVGGILASAVVASLLYPKKDDGKKPQMNADEHR